VLLLAALAVGSASADGGQVSVSYRDAVLADAPVAYWRLGETSGIVAGDEAASHDGEYRGGVALGEPGAVAGDADPAAGFDGANDSVRIRNAPSLNPTSALSIETWLRPGSLASSSLVRKDTQYMLRLTSGGRIVFRIWKGGTANEVSVPGAVTADSWSHLVATWNGSTMELWVDGVLRATRALAAPSASGSQSLYLGSTNQSYDWLDGTLDEIALYDKALTPERIQAHFATAQ
jgi:hypothetical protein